MLYSHSDFLSMPLSLSWRIKGVPHKEAKTRYFAEIEDSTRTCTNSRRHKMASALIKTYYLRDESKINVVLRRCRRVVDLAGLAISEGDGSISNETRRWRLGLRNWEGPLAGEPDDGEDRKPLMGVDRRMWQSDRVTSSKGDRTCRLSSGRP